jgi:hypothetical protein
MNNLMEKAATGFGAIILAGLAAACDDDFTYPN